MARRPSTARPPAVRLLPRSARTGRIVTLKHALSHPNTTVIEHVRVPRPKPKKS